MYIVKGSTLVIMSKGARGWNLEFFGNEGITTAQIEACRQSPSLYNNSHAFNSAVKTILLETSLRPYNTRTAYIMLQHEGRREKDDGEEGGPVYWNSEVSSASLSRNSIFR